MKRAIVLLFIVAAAAVVFFPEFAHACPNCKDAYLDGDGASVAAGFNVSIIFMISIPLLLVGSLGVRIWLAIRRKTRLDAAGFPGSSN